MESFPGAADVDVANGVAGDAGVLGAMYAVIVAEPRPARGTVEELAEEG
jgi:hypothetical protein